MKPNIGYLYKFKFLTTIFRYCTQKQRSVVNKIVLISPTTSSHANFDSSIEGKPYTLRK